MPDFYKILQNPAVRELVQELAQQPKKQVMTTSPQIISFGYDANSDSRSDETPALSLIISVPDAIVATHLLAHITALTNQYHSVQAQAEAGATAAPVVAEPVPAAVAPVIVPGPGSARTTPTTTTPPTKAAAAPAKPAKVVMTKVPKKTAPPKEQDLPAATTAAKVDPKPAVGLDPGKVKFPEPANPTVVASAPAAAEHVAAAQSAKEAAPAEPSGEGESCPPALASYTSMRQVLGWMLDHNYTTVDMIVAKCEEYAAHCTPIGRAISAQGGLTERVSRGLDVVLKSRGAAA